MRVEIEVTAVDIAEGRRGSWLDCPLSLAAARSLPGLQVRVLTKDLHIFRPAETPTCWALLAIAPLPPEAVEWVRTFDSGGEVRPISFAIDVTTCGSAA